jgi:hypothetical protein
VPPGEPRLIALAGAGGAVAIGVIVGAVLAVRALTRDSDRATLGPPSDGAEVARAGMQAPGTNELRQIGCDPAIVIDLERLLRDAAAVREGEPRYIVTCDVTRADPPTCGRAAETYFAALGGMAQGNVNVRISRPGSTAPLCSRLYAPSGRERVP